jgi:hypothetical protein
MMSFRAKMKILSLCLAVSAAPSASAGTKIGTGGDAVRCQRPTEAGQPAEGLYSLDYLLTRSSEFGEPSSTSHWSNSVYRIRRILQVPGFYDAARSLWEFEQQYLNTTNSNLKYMWEPAPLRLADLKDEKIISSVPANCLDPNGFGPEANRIAILQAVIRFEGSEAGRSWDEVLFKYVPEVLDELKETNPVQLSYLLIHEWLWTISDNVVINRRLNSFLHSKLADRMNEREIEAKLKEMRIEIRGTKPPPADPNEFARFFNLNCRGKNLTKTWIEALPGYPHRIDKNIETHMRRRICKGGRCTEWEYEDSKLAYHSRNSAPKAITISPSLYAKIDKHSNTDKYRIYFDGYSNNLMFCESDAMRDLSRDSDLRCAFKYARSSSDPEQQVSLRGNITQSCIHMNSPIVKLWTTEEGDQVEGEWVVYGEW